MQIVELAPVHAKEASRLHIAGQPGTFLTSLGPDVLLAVYRALPELPAGFGYVALADPVSASDCSSGQSATVLGFVSATTSIGRLFVETGRTQFGKLLPPMLRQLARRPSLIWRSMQTVLYPLLVHGDNPIDGGAAAEPAGSKPVVAELLSIMVEPGMRGQGIGAQLLQALLGECRRRAIRRLDVTVDAQNAGAQHFYARHGFVQVRSFVLYGREMHLYGLDITEPLLGGEAGEWTGE